MPSLAGHGSAAFVGAAGPTLSFSFPRGHPLKCNARPAPRARPAQRSARVTCMSRPSWSVDIEGEKDDKLFDLEERLHSAIDDEKYEAAEDLTKEITRLQSGGFAELLTSFYGYYNAMNSQSIVDMARVFTQDDSVTCKHPLARRFPIPSRRSIVL